MMCRLIVVTGVLAIGLSLGCEPRDRTDAPRMSEQELITRSQLDPYPDPVKAGFLRDYPGASVRNVDVYNDVTGRLVYQVNYVRGGQAGNALYDAAGNLVAAPAPRVGHPQQPAAPSGGAP